MDALLRGPSQKRPHKRRAVPRRAIPCSRRAITIFHSIADEDARTTQPPTFVRSHTPISVKTQCQNSCISYLDNSPSTSLFLPAHPVKSTGLLHRVQPEPG